MIHAMRWPRRNRFGKSIDNSSILRGIIELLENERVYNPGLKVWKHLVIAAARDAPKDESRWSIVVRVFKCLRWSKPGYCADTVLLKSGLDASKALKDPELASDLMWRAVENYRDYLPNLGLAGKASAKRSKVPRMDFVKALEICVNENDIVACKRIMTCAKRAGLSSRNLQPLFLLLAKRYAQNGDAENVEKTLLQMIRQDIRPW